MEEKEHKTLEKRKVDISTHEEAREGNWYVPLADIWETEEDIRIILDVPGVKSEDVTLSIQQNELILTGHVSHEDEVDRSSIYREYNVGHYHRHFFLPDSIDRDKISADMADGVLTLILPKAEEVKPRRIKIQTKST